jgi:hypothetical protein
MFFRREKPHQWTFQERVNNLKPLGFESAADGSGRVRVTRKGFGAVLEDLGDGKVGIGKAGLVAGKEIATLVHGGFQMFLRTPSGREFPALADQLKALHAFDEDLREGLGLISLYNTSLGTTADDHLYDRLEGRDEPAHPRPWESHHVPTRETR